MEGKSKPVETSLDAVKEFARDTTCHGVGGIVRTKHAVIKVFWSLVVITAMGIMLYQVVRVFGYYFQYKVKTNSDYAKPGFTEFPSVTVCNLNSVRENALENAVGAPYDPLRRKYQAVEAFEDRLVRGVIQQIL
jgi:hypothetical protein